MIKSAIRLLPGVIASAMVLAGPSRAAAASHRWEQSGQASWYGAAHQGRPTSSGQLFDQNAMTAAHANLPLGSRVRVTRKDTGDSVVVLINDRQPPKGNRVIDLSRKAASRLGMVDQGVSMVKLAKIDENEPIEVAEAPETRRANGARPDSARADSMRPGIAAFSPRRHDRPHTHRAPP